MFGCRSTTDGILLVPTSIRRLEWKREPPYLVRRSSKPTNYRLFRLAFKSLQLILELAVPIAKTGSMKFRFILAALEVYRLSSITCRYPRLPILMHLWYNTCRYLQLRLRVRQIHQILVLRKLIIVIQTLGIQQGARGFDNLP
jgi:hypothetical protein